MDYYDHKIRVDKQTITKTVYVDKKLTDYQKESIKLAKSLVPYKTVGGTHYVKPWSKKNMERQSKDILYHLQKKPTIKVKWKTKEVDTGYKGRKASYWYNLYKNSTNTTVGKSYPLTV